MESKKNEKIIMEKVWEKMKIVMQILLETKFMI